MLVDYRSDLNHQGKQKIASQLKRVFFSNWADFRLKKDRDKIVSNFSRIVPRKYILRQSYEKFHQKTEYFGFLIKVPQKLPSQMLTNL